MTQEQAEKLAQAIREQFAHVEAHAFQSVVRPPAWVVDVRHRDVPPESQSLIIYSEQEWEDALLAVKILSK